MSRLLGLRYRLRSMLRRSAADRETRDEIAYHLECAERSYVARGMSPRDARRRAFSELGGVDAWREAAAEQRTGAIVESVWQDAKFALRSFRRRPGFVASVVATLALGIGANTAVFSLIHAVLLRPIGVPNPDRLVAIYQASSAQQPYERSSYPEVQDIAARVRRLSGIAALAPFTIGLQTHEWSHEARAGLVSPNYFDVLGIKPAVGRFIGRGDETSPLVVISHAYWEQRFRGANVVGQRVNLGVSPFTIVGVGPRGFHGTNLSDAIDVWVPMATNTLLPVGGMFAKSDLWRNRVVPLMYPIGRLAPGASLVDAQHELNAALAAVRADNPPPRRNARQIVPNPLTLLEISRAATIKDRQGLVRFVRITVGTVLLTFLLACVNVANLLLIRGGERSRELGVRSALGAGAARLARQLVVENLLLSLLGGFAGLVVAWLTIRMLGQFTLPGGVALDHVSLGLTGQVLAFTIALSIATSVFFGLGPAWQAARQDAMTTLRAGGYRATHGAPRGSLVVVQVAISLVLLVSASLLLRSVQAGWRTNLGFDPHPLLAMDVHPRLLSFSLDRTRSLYADVLARASRLSGVRSAAIGTHVPLQPTFEIPLSEGPGRIAGIQDGRRVAAKSDKTMNVALMGATPRFFETLGIRVLAGRDISVADTPQSTAVVVINQATADAFWPNESPLGKQLNLFGDDTYTVVGVVPNLKYATLGDGAALGAYTAIEQDPGGRATIVVRSIDPSRTLVEMNALARELNATVPVLRIRRVSDQVDAVLMPQRFGATLLGVFSVLALGISAVGLYGAVAFGVSRRTTEIGVRIALGAEPRSVVWLLMRATAVAVGIGVLAGTVAAVVAGRALAHFLFGVAPVDPSSFVAGIVALGSAAMVATLIPAWRGSRIEPLRSLRSD